MPDYIYIILFAALLLAAIITIIRIVSSSAQKRLIKAVKDRYEGKKIHGMTSSSTFFGETSKGSGQIRGLGTLVLAEDELYFLMAVPRKEVVIPYSKITRVELKKSHLGKSVGRDLLHVSYETEKEHDSSAWRVREPEKWVDAIEKLRVS